MLKIFFKMQAWGTEAHFEWLIGNSLRYLIHLIKNNNKKQELFCHLKSENIFYQLNKYSFLKSLMTDNHETHLIFCLALGLQVGGGFYSFVFTREFGTKPTADVYATCIFFKDLLPCSPYVAPVPVAVCLGRNGVLSLAME